LIDAACNLAPIDSLAADEILSLGSAGQQILSSIFHLQPKNQLVPSYKQHRSRKNQSTYFAQALNTAQQNAGLPITSPLLRSS
jgi:hypothetical protein